MKYVGFRWVNRCQLFFRSGRHALLCGETLKRAVDSSVPQPSTRFPTSVSRSVCPMIFAFDRVFCIFFATFSPSIRMTYAVTCITQGVEEALLLMKVGDKWQLTCPADLAFGNKGRPPSPGRPRYVPNHLMSSFSRPWGPCGLRHGGKNVPRNVFGIVEGDGGGYTGLTPRHASLSESRIAEHNTVPCW